MSRIKVFFSYTIRDGLIDKDLLFTLKNKMVDLNLFDSYIDLVDNNSDIPQLYVFNQLKTTDILCVINTPRINESPWVKKELSIAKKYSIPILSVSFNDFLNILECEDNNSLCTNNIIISIINTIVKFDLT